MKIFSTFTTVKYQNNFWLVKCMHLVEVFIQSDSGYTFLLVISNMLSHHALSCEVARAPLDFESSFQKTKITD